MSRSAAGCGRFPSSYFGAQRRSGRWIGAWEGFREILGERILCGSITGVIDRQKPAWLLLE
jgi:hypothetical protein